MSESSLASRIALVTEGSDRAPLDWLRQRMRVIEMRTGDAAFGSALASADALLVRTYTRVNDELLAKAPRLKVVARGGVGLENIDVPACRRRGVEVVYTPDANTLAVGDYVFGAMLQLLRPWAAFTQSAYSPAEFKRVRDTLRGQQLNELTVGILGMGRVGRRVGHIAASGFGMRVLYNDLLDVAGKLDFPAEAVEKGRLYREADVLTIHVDMRPGNAHLVGSAQLALMKPGALLINSSRGEVLDAAALAEALRTGRLIGAALDVFAP
ncbi:MAG TPA: NAD(P)-dependent oxidoreductase, partial [Tepidisphaeraceae bacterium]|nr:NAD(P)-dependent oxidoreductase [Tepidisphaeraceae bacterium]